MQLVVARVRAWQSAVALPFEHEYELHRFQSIHGRSITSSGEDEQVLLLGAIPLLQHDLPEPLHHGRFRREAVGVESHLLEFIEVEVTLAADKLFKILGIEEGF